MGIRVYNVVLLVNEGMGKSVGCLSFSFSFGALKIFRILVGWLVIVIIYTFAPRLPCPGSSPLTLRL
jgi:hypothetical protein